MVRRFARRYLKVKDPKNARDAADRAVKEQPSNVKALYRRGLASVMNGSREMLGSALSDFQAVMKVEPDNTQCLKELRGVEGKLELMNMGDSDTESPGKPMRVKTDGGEGGIKSNDSSPSAGFDKLTDEDIQEAKLASPTGKTRIAIEEDSDDSSEEEEEEEVDKEALSDKAKTEGNELLQKNKLVEAIAKCVRARRR